MESLQGHFLVASTRLNDPNFFRSVILVVQHNDEGALGLVLNRVLEPTLKDVWEQVSDGPCYADSPIHRGGPCEGPLLVLHTDGNLSQIEVLPGVHFTTEKDAVEQLVAETEPGPLKFFVGYAGWTAGQLEAELAEQSWGLLPATREQIFIDDVENIWANLRKAIARASTPPWVNPKFIPDDPSVN